MNYYNEFDLKTAAWLEELIKEGLIPNGKIDTRSIRDVQPGDLDGFTQCHFFAGIGGWPYALRLAGWPEDREVWTGSCPCQPLSCAGLGKGHADERHLWPAFYRLIAERRPATVFGEQVASKDGREWFSGIRADLEGMGYAVGGADLCAAGVGAPHIRQRLYWVANSPGRRINERPETERKTKLARRGENSRLAHTEGGGLGAGGSAPGSAGHAAQRDADGAECGMDNAVCNRSETRLSESKQRKEGHSGIFNNPSSERNFWSDAIWHQCRDGKARRISPQPEIFPLAPGLPGRVGILRGAGNAIVPQVAQIFIESVMQSID